MRSVSALSGLALTLGCLGPRSLETRLGAQRIETYQALAEKVRGKWQVSLPMPAGEWAVKTEEPQHFIIIPGSQEMTTCSSKITTGSRSATLVWIVEPERWSRQDKPFRFKLKSGVQGAELQMSVIYPPMLNAPARILLEVLGRSRAQFPG